MLAGRARHRRTGASKDGRGFPFYALELARGVTPHFFGGASARAPGRVDLAEPQIPTGASEHHLPPVRGTHPPLFSPTIILHGHSLSAQRAAALACPPSRIPHHTTFAATVPPAPVTHPSPARARASTARHFRTPPLNLSHLTCNGPLLPPSQATRHQHHRLHLFCLAEHISAPAHARQEDVPGQHPGPLRPAQKQELVARLWMLGTARGG